MNPFKIFNSSNPAVKKQKQYKKMAKRRGLLSFTESMQAIKEGNDIRGEKFHSDTLAAITKEIISEARKDKPDSIKFENVVLFSPNNLNDHYLTPDTMQEMVDEFNNTEDEDRQDTLNVDHSQTIQDQIGSFSNVRYDEDTNTIIGDVEITRLDNSRLNDMLQVLSESDELQLGLSIEFTAEDWDFIDGKFAYVDTTLVGLALTLTPSAPQTLMTNSVKENEETVADKNEESNNGDTDVKEVVEENTNSTNDTPGNSSDIEELKNALESALATITEQAKLLNEQSEKIDTIVHVIEANNQSIDAINHALQSNKVVVDTIKNQVALKQQITSNKII